MKSSIFSGVLAGCFVLAASVTTSIAAPAQQTSVPQSMTQVQLTFAPLVKRDAPATVAFRIKEILEQTLQAGFTTIRDAFGLDWGFVQATERGYVKGPRILFVGSCLSQTGGHGDWREPYAQRAPVEGIHGLMAVPRICDTPDEMRRAARDMLRMGAHGIKLMAGGGCMSPTDEIEHTQFTIEEMAAACYEARTVGKIALAHVYTPQGIMNAVAAGVRSIEHGNFIDEEAAACMRQAGAHFVPTLTTYFLISAYGEAENIPPKMLAKINKAKQRGLESLQVARAAGLKICSGSDVLGSMQPFKSMELGLKAQVLGNHEAILSATRTNADLFGMARDIGTIEAGKLADLIVVDGNPLDDITVLQDANNIALVMRDGQVFKNLLAKDGSRSS